MPARIQMRRVKGWRMPEGAVYVGRPSRWGNPYKVGAEVQVGGRGLDTGRAHVVVDAADAVRLYRKWIWTQGRIEGLTPALRGHDLACWCRLDAPCHADVLLELANRLDKNPI